MRLLLTLNLPSARGDLIQQIIVDHSSEQLIQFCQSMNRDEFIICRQWYKRKDPYTKEVMWEDRGDIVLNTHHIAKAAEYILDLDYLENNYDESQGRSEFRRQHASGPRGPIRPGRYGV